MNASAYIRKKICELIMQFPEIKLAYEFNQYSDTHIIEVLPLEVYKDDLAYHDAETDFAIEFDEKYSPSSILFVSEESLTRVIKPEIERAGWMYNLKPSISGSKTFNFEGAHIEYEAGKNNDYYLAA